MDADRFREIRKFLGLSQEKLAAKILRGKQIVSKYETDDVTIPTLVAEWMENEVGREALKKTSAAFEELVKRNVKDQRSCDSLIKLLNRS